MTRALRRFIARLGIVVLLFMQLAVAAYACPGMQRAADASMAMSASDVAMDDCPMGYRSDPNLCKEHCQHDGQATGQASAPVFAVDLPLLAVLPVVEVPPAPVAPGVSPEFLAHATAPPPAIRFGVFRS